LRQDLRTRTHALGIGCEATRLSAFSLAGLAAFVGFALLLLSLLPSPALDDFDEAMYAGIAAGMNRTGDLITPRANGIRHLDKPPLLFWLMAASYRALGVSALPARLPTAMAGVMGLVVTYLLGKELYGRRAGLAGAAVLASSFGYLIYATTITTDLLFSALVSAAVLLFLLAWLREDGGKNVLAGFAVSGLAVLAKGPLGLMLPMGVFALFFAFRGWPSFIGATLLMKGVALSILLAGPWFIAAAIANDGFLRFYFLGEHVGRLLETRAIQDSVPLGCAAFLAVSLLWLLPWSVYVPLAVGQAFEDRRNGPSQEKFSRQSLGRCVLPIWVCLVMGLFCLARLRLENYSIPAWPPLAILIGAALMNPQAPRRRILLPLGLLLLLQVGGWLAWLWPERAHTLGVGLLALVDGHYRTMEAGIYSGARVAYPELAPMMEVLRGILLSLGAGTIGAFLFLLRGRRGMAVGALAAGMLAAFVFCQRGRTLFEPVRSSAALAQAIPPGERVRVVCDGPYEKYSSLAFYSGRERMLVLDGDRGFLEWGARFAEARGTFIGKDELARLWRSGATVFLATDSEDWEAWHERLSPVSVAASSGKAVLLVNKRPPANGERN